MRSTEPDAAPRRRLSVTDHVQALALRLAAHHVGIDEAVERLLLVGGRDRAAVEEARRRCEDDHDLGVQPDITRRAGLLLTALLTTGFWRREGERSRGHDGPVAGLDPVALPVRDVVASLGFYRDLVGGEGTVREEPSGLVITTATGVALTLCPGEPRPDAGALRFELSLADAAAVHRARAGLADRGVPELEWRDQPGRVSVTVPDPDGYVVELSWHEGPRSP